LASKSKPKSPKIAAVEVKVEEEAAKSVQRAAELVGVEPGPS
jgi:hypothetical protein